MPEDSGRTGTSERRSSVDQVLTGTVAVITGASSAIGEAAARGLAAAGAAVALLARRRDRLDRLAAEIAATGQAQVYEVDVADSESVRATVERVTTELGGIDILVNNAGYGVWGASPRR